MFVYGTLKRGFGNHSLLKDSEFQGSAVVQGTLYVHGLPYYRREGSGSVYGELYRVDDDTLARLDRLEGYREHNPETSFYNRVKVVVTDADEVSGEYCVAYAYEYNGSIDPKFIKENGVYDG